MIQEVEGEGPFSPRPISQYEKGVHSKWVKFHFSTGIKNGEFQWAYSLFILIKIKTIIFLSIQTYYLKKKFHRYMISF